MNTDINALCHTCQYSLAGIDLTGHCPECGTKIITNCHHCDYDLSETDPHTNCPECGIPAIISAGMGALQSTKIQTIQSVASGFSRVKNLILLLILFAFLSGVFGAIALSFNVDEFVLMLVIAILGFLFSITLFASWWKLSAPVEIPEQLDSPARRKFLKVTLLIYLASIFTRLVPLIYPADVMSNEYTLAHIIEIVTVSFSLLALVLMYFSQILYLAWYAKILRNQKMRKRATFLLWAGPIKVFLLLFFSFLSAFIGVIFMGIGGLVIAVFALVLLVVYWNLIHYLHKDLKKIIKGRTRAFTG